MSPTYVTDITHYLVEGEVPPDLPAPARKLASFLVLIIDEATRDISVRGKDTGIRCRRRGCKGSIVASVVSMDGEIVWVCPICGHNGVIRNWQGTKWNQQAGELA